MYKRLLVPLDGSELAEVALPYAEEVAKKLGSEIILLNIRSAGEDPDNPEHRAYLSKMAATVEQEVRKSEDVSGQPDIKVASAIIGPPNLFAQAAEAILEYIEEAKINLVVMATHGRTGITRWALGSTADKVVRGVKCPVLLIRANMEAPTRIKLGRLLVPLDGSPQSETVLSHVENLAPKFQAKVTLLHVVVPPYHIYPATDVTAYYGGAGIYKVPYSGEELQPLQAASREYLKKVSDTLTSRGITTDIELRVGGPGEEIIKAAEEMGIDLVTMSTHGESGLTRWDHGSIADKVLHAGSTPLLLVRERQT